MKIYPTQHLFFNRFTCSCRFDITAPRKTSVRNNAVIQTIKKILADSNQAYRTRLDWTFTDSNSIQISFNCYFNSVEIQDLLINSEHKDLITYIYKPASDLHAELLRSKVEIHIRDHLLYNRFRYKVQLRGVYTEDRRTTIIDWLHYAFSSKIHGRRGDWLLLGNWQYNVYLKEHTDLVLIQLSLGEYIGNILRVDLFSEHGIKQEDLAALNPGN